MQGGFGCPAFFISVTQKIVAEERRKRVMAGRNRPRRPDFASG
jgi:hypothetical protein